MAAQGWVPAEAAGRDGSVARGSGGGRAVPVRRQGLVAARRRALPGRGRHLRGGRGAAEARAQARLAAAGDDVRLPGRGRCLPFAGQLVTQAGAAPVAATLQIVYLGVFPTALAFSTWAYALSRTTAGKMGATTYAVPVLAVVMSWAFLDAVPGWLTLLGGLLCLAGVAVSRTRGGRRGRKATASPTPTTAMEGSWPRTPMGRAGA